MKPPVQEPSACRWFQYACSRAIRVVIECTPASEHRALNHDLQERRMMLTAPPLLLGAQRSSPEFLSVDREINILQSCLFSKHFFRRTSFKYVFFPFWWRSMLSSHVVFPLGLFPVIFNCITTLSIDSSSLLMTMPNHRSKFLSITRTMGSLLVSMIHQNC